MPELHADDNGREREAITEQCLANCPKESPKQLPEDEWNRQYISPWQLVNMQHLRNALHPQEGHNAIYCRVCLEHRKHQRIRAWKLYVTWEDDPLKNFPCLIHLVCHNCDFEQFVPMPEGKDPRYRPTRDQMMDDMMARQQGKSAVMGAAYGAGVAGMGGAFQQQLSTYEERLKEMQRQGAPQDMVMRERDRMMHELELRGLAANPPPPDPRVHPGQRITGTWLDETSEFPFPTKKKKKR